MSIRAVALAILSIPLIFIVAFVLTYWSKRSYDAPIIRYRSVIESAQLSPHPEKIRVVSFNLFYQPADRALRLDTAAEGMSKLAPDVVFLQEVATQGIYKDDPVKFLSERLGLPYAAYSPLEDVLLFKQGLAILSRYPIQNVTAHVFEKNLPVETKGYLTATIATPNGLLHAIDVHLMNASGDSFGKNSQYEKLLALIDQFEPTGPVLLAGDFNAERGDPVFDEFTRRLSAQDLHALFPPNRERPYSWNHEALLDYVFLVDSKTTPPHRSRCRLSSGGIEKFEAVHGVEPSDHLPILAELSCANTP